MHSVILSIEAFKHEIESFTPVITELHGPHKSKVYLLGTNHFSIKSKQRAIDLIRIVKPHRVVLEQDESRRSMLDVGEKAFLRKVNEFSLLDKIDLLARVLDFGQCLLSK